MVVSGPLSLSLSLLYSTVHNNNSITSHQHQIKIGNVRGFGFRFLGKNAASLVCYSIARMLNSNQGGSRYPKRSGLPSM